MLPDISRSDVYRLDGQWLGTDQALRYLRNLGFSWSQARSYLSALDEDRKKYYAVRAARGLRAEEVQP